MSVSEGVKAYPQSLLSSVSIMEWWGVNVSHLLLVLLLKVLWTWSCCSHTAECRITLDVTIDTKPMEGMHASVGPGFVDDAPASQHTG